MLYWSCWLVHLRWSWTPVWWEIVTHGKPYQPVCRRMINWGDSTLLGLVQPAISPGNEETHSRTFILNILNILNKELPVAGIGVGLLQTKDAWLKDMLSQFYVQLNCQQIHALHRRQLPLNHHDDHCPLKPHSCWFILVHYLGRWTGIALWRLEPPTSWFARGIGHEDPACCVVTTSWSFVQWTFRRKPM